VLRRSEVPGLQGRGLEATLIAAAAVAFVTVSLLAAVATGKALDELGDE
jgi:hypothetical protein